MQNILTDKTYFRPTNYCNSGRFVSYTASFYKVVTEEMKSLGLRKNPTILTYKLGKWIKSPTIKANKDDDGGIWVAKNLSSAKKIQKYMMDKYGIKCQIYSVRIGESLYGNSYRIKTDKVKFIEAV